MSSVLRRFITQDIFQDLPVIPEYAVDLFDLFMFYNFLGIVVLVPAPFVAEFLIYPSRLQGFATLQAG
jgi:hypothetical protein